MNRTHKLKALRGQSFFESVPTKFLEELVDYSIERPFSRGDCLWNEGVPANRFTFVVQGKFKLIKHRLDGGETLLGVYEEGDAMGYVAAVRQMRYPATAIALESGCCLEITRSHLIRLLQRDETLLNALIEGLMARSSDLVRRVEVLTTTGAEQRLAMLFVSLAEKHGRRIPLEQGMGIHVELHLSRKEIAELLNVRIETAIRLMSRWNKGGPVRTVTDGFLIDDPAYLEQLVCGEDL